MGIISWQESDEIRRKIGLLIGLFLLGMALGWCSMDRAEAAPVSNYHQTASAPALGKLEVQAAATTFVVNSKHGSRVAVGRLKLTGKYAGYAVMHYDKGIYRVTIRANVAKNPRNGNVRVASYRVLLKRDRYPGENR
jgi:hypothetical protein